MQRNKLIPLSTLIQHWKLSTTACTLPKETNLRLPLDENNLCLDHETKWHTIPNTKYDALSFPAGLRKSLIQEVKSFRECCFMVRRPTLDVIHAMKHTRPENPIMKYVLYGRHGCGKTVTMHHVMYWAHANNWVVCSFPRAYIYRRNANESIQSTWKSNRIDLPEEASLWLNQFKKANLSLMQNPEFITTSTYNWAPGETTKTGQPLMDLVTMGTTRIKTASDCLAVLLKELKHYAKERKIKLLVAIDQMNSLFGPTMLRRMDNYYAQPEDVTIMRAMLELLKFDWNNGACVGVIDSFEKGEHLPGSPATAHLPYYLLGKHGMDFLEPFLPVEIPAYTKEEALSCVDYYVDRRWLTSVKATAEEGRQELVRLACYNPLLLDQMCGAH